MNIDKLLAAIRERYRTRQDADFVENDHPRDKGGQFTKKGNEGSGGSETPEKAGTIAKPKGPAKMNVCASLKTFIGKVAEAAKTCDPRAAWRVTVPSSEESFNKEHPGSKIYDTEHGSTCAVTPDGDIVSVCKKAGDQYSGKQLLEFAVKNGGKKLDSFSGNHRFYTSCGFEPVSWCGFSEEYAPDGWEKGKGKDKWEPVIFYKYTGRKREEIEKDYPNVNSFLKSVKKSADYDTAKFTRDSEMEK